uniref:MAU2 chromatid cohesion factor homolog n=1 Tax=Globodera rostochiensis TaxID=31243 RepID=A0A914I245_GLORO
MKQAAVSNEIPLDTPQRLRIKYKQRAFRRKMEKFPQLSRVPAPPGVSSDQAAISLMAMAEIFRTANKYKMAIKCVMTSLRVPCSPELFALCSYELGKLLWLYTNNMELAQFHLCHAHQLMRQLGPPLEQSRLKTAALLAEVLLARRLFSDSVQVLRSELSESQKCPTLHTKMLFLIAEAYLRLSEFARALEAVQAGVQFSRGPEGGGVMVECYFRLVKSLVLSIQMTDQQELGKSVGELGEILQMVAANNDQSAINDIRAFCYTIQLCYFLAIGMVKSSKQCLRQLHITVQSAEAAKSASSPFQSSNSSVQIRWLSSELLAGLAYALTVLCNIQYSNFERAHRYYGTALKHFEGMKVLMRKSNWPMAEHRLGEFVVRMELVLHEAVSQSHLVLGNPQDSISSIASMFRSISKLAGACRLQVLSDFEPQLHILLGLYATHLRDLDSAERQFSAALKTCSKDDPELWTMANLGLALIFLFSGREAQFYELFDALSPSRIRSQANSLRSAAHLIHGFHYFLNSRQPECKKQLMDSIAISKEEDMARLQSIALLLLAKLLSSKDVLKAAYEWTNKSGDIGLLLWANSEIRSIGSADDKAKVVEEIEAQRQRLDGARAESARGEAHALIKWVNKEMPDVAHFQQ